jgi:hypothetical protein
MAAILHIHQMIDHKRRGEMPADPLQRAVHILHEGGLLGRVARHLGSGSS